MCFRRPLPFPPPELGQILQEETSKSILLLSIKVAFGITHAINTSLSLIAGLGMRLRQTHGKPLQWASHTSMAYHYIVMYHIAVTLDTVGHAFTSHDPVSNFLLACQEQRPSYPCRHGTVDSHHLLNRRSPFALCVHAIWFSSSWKVHSFNLLFCTTQHAHEKRKNLYHLKISTIIYGIPAHDSCNEHHLQICSAILRS